MNYYNCMTQIDRKHPYEASMFKPKVRKEFIGDQINDDDDIHIGNQTIKFREFRNREVKIQNLKPSEYDLLCFWDDTIQITSLGILDYFVAKGIEQPDLSKIFQRPENVTWYDAVYDSLKNYVSKEDFHRYFEEFYDESLRRGPLTDALRVILLMDHILENLTLVFRFRSPEVDNAIRVLTDRQTRRCAIHVKYLSEDKVENIVRSHRGNVICTETPGRIYDILMKNKQAGRMLLCPFPHTDMALELIVYGYKLAEERKDERIILPLATNLDFYEEKLYVI